MPDQPTIVPVNCFECGGPIEVACEVPAEGGESQRVRFECPYCGTPREVAMPGMVLWIAMRPHGGGPEIRH